MIQTITRLDDKFTINRITGERAHLVWFTEVFVIHKEFVMDREHTDELCWCHPLSTDVKPFELRPHRPTDRASRF